MQENGLKKNLTNLRTMLSSLQKRLFSIFTEQVVASMEAQGISRAELAKRLGVSKAFITKLLNGNPNLTIKTMVSLAKTLDCDLSIDLHISPTKIPNVSKKQSGQVLKSRKSRNSLQL